MFSALWARNTPHHMCNTHKTHTNECLCACGKVKWISPYRSKCFFTRHPHTLILIKRFFKENSVSCGLSLAFGLLVGQRNHLSNTFCHFMKWICQLISLRHSNVKYYFEFVGHFNAIQMENPHKNLQFCLLLLSIFCHIFAAFFFLCYFAFDKFLFNQFADCVQMCEFRFVALLFRTNNKSVAWIMAIKNDSKVL